MRTFSPRNTGRCRVRTLAIHDPELIAGVVLLVLGLLLLFPLAARAQDSVLTTEQLESLDSQFSDTDTTDEIGSADDGKRDDSLWEEYQQYSNRDDEEHTSGERVKIGDEVVVWENEHIRGDVVSVGGRVTVHGYVEGDVVAIGGDVVLHEGAEVEGDVVSVGGRVRDLGSARVHGEKVSVNIPLPLNWNWTSRDSNFSLGLPNFVSVGFNLGFLFVGLLLALLAYAVSGRRIDVMSRRVEAEPGQSFLVGMLGAFGTPLAIVIAAILLAITFIGILLIPVLLIFVWVVAFGGFVAVILAVGRRLSELRQKELQATRSAYQSILIGFVGLHAFGLLGSLFELGGGFFMTLAVLCEVLQAFVLLFACTLGYGALLLSRFGTQLPSADVAFAGAGQLSASTPMYGSGPAAPGTSPPPIPGSPPPPPPPAPASPAGGMPDPPEPPPPPDAPGSPDEPPKETPRD